MRFLAVQPTGDSLADLYGADYFARDFRCGRSDTDYFREDAFRAENDGLLDAFERLRPPGRLLEVGAAGGWLLKRAHERGWSVKGSSCRSPRSRTRAGSGSTCISEISSRPSFRRTRTTSSTSATCSSTCPIAAPC